MLRKLQNRGTAVMITICVVVLSVFLGSWRTLSEMRSQAQGIFYDGWSDLYDGTEYCENLLVVADRYIDEDHALVRMVERNIQEVYNTTYGKSMAKTHAAVEELLGAVEDLDAYLQKADLSENDEIYRQKLVVNIQTSFRLLGQGGYNQAAQEFNRALGRFPANILGGITGVKPLELYE